MSKVDQIQQEIKEGGNIQYITNEVWYNDIKPILVDDSIKKEEFITIQDTTSNSIFNDAVPSNNRIAFKINNNTDYIDLSRAMLKVQLKLVRKTNGTDNWVEINANDKVAFSNNVIGHLLASGRLKLGGTEISSVSNIEHYSTVQLLDNLSCEELKTNSDMLFFYSFPEDNELSLDNNDNPTEPYELIVDGPDNDVIGVSNNPNYNKNFTTRMNRTKLNNGVGPIITILYPLKYLFSFCRDIKGHLLHMEDIEIEFDLTSNINRCVEVVNVVNGPASFRPRIARMDLLYVALQPALEAETDLVDIYNRQLESNVAWYETRIESYPSHTANNNSIDWRIGSYTGRIDGVFVMFVEQDWDKDNATVPKTVYSNVELRGMRIESGSTHYPAKFIDTDFNNLQDWAFAYNEFLRSSKKKSNRIDEQGVVTYKKFGSIYSLYYFDLSRDIKLDTTQNGQLTLKGQLVNPNNKNYNIYAIVYQEKMMRSVSYKNGKKTIV